MTDCNFLTFCNRRKHTYFGCTPSYERPGEGNFEEACLHPCHLLLGYQELISVKRLTPASWGKGKNSAMDVSFPHEIRVAKVCFVLERRKKLGMYDAVLFAFLDASLIEADICLGNSEQIVRLASVKGERLSRSLGIDTVLGTKSGVHHAKPVGMVKANTVFLNSELGILSQELTYPTLVKGKSSSSIPWVGIYRLVPGRVTHAPHFVH